MRINHNIAALNTHRQLNAANANQSKSMEKLSSGLRINRAGDDAAGLAISEKMRAQVRGLDQASANAQDGISMIQTTEGALNETHSILQRMRELAVQSSNDTNTESDRGEIQKEMNQLTSEINRIGNTTEFNGQSLLKGKDAKVTETAGTPTVITAGEAGKVTGGITSLKTVANSVVGKPSSATIQASTSTATGNVTKLTETKASVKAEKSSVSLANGMTFESTAADALLNGKSITIVQGTTAGEVSKATKDGSDNITITVGQTADGKSLASNRGELYNELIAGLANGSDGAGANAITEITVKKPADTSEALGSIASTGTLVGGKTEVQGEYTFKLDKAFTEAGDTIEINGKTYTAVIGATANASKGEFLIGTDATVANRKSANDQADSLLAAIKASDTTFDATSSATTGTITLKEAATKATGVKMADPVVKGSGEDAKLIITNTNGKNLNTITLSQSADDTLKVDTDGAGNLKIELAKTTASNNSLEKIADAIKALGTKDGIDFSKFEVKAEGNWNGDPNILGNALNKPVGTLVGGTVEVKGEYSFDVDKAFAAGDILEIKGQKFTAVDGPANASKGEFSVNGDKAAQAAGIADAISLNANLKGQFTSTVSGSTVTLKEIAATGTDLKQDDLTVRAVGTQGEYAVKVDELLENGAAFKLDGQEIKVSNKNNHVGYANGTAIKEAATAKDQADALAAAINANETLKAKYEASVNDSGELVLKQTEANTTDKAPEVSSSTSPLGKFTASFQVGANSNQSMTIEVEDMRSSSLGVASDGSEKTIMSADGKVASYVEVSGVTDGTTNTNTEFALDITSHEKATAAISVINDAIEKVSAQRSNLGAYQNRLDHTINNLGTSSENLTAAESRIRDVDMAKEMMNQTKESILAQASQAMLAQANQKPQSVLQLLG